MIKVYTKHGAKNWVTYCMFPKPNKHVTIDKIHDKPTGIKENIFRESTKQSIIFYEPIIHEPYVGF